LRVVVALALVLVTFNPAGWSFYHWISAPPAGIVLGIGLSWSLIRTRATGQVEVD